MYDELTTEEREQQKRRFKIAGRLARKYITYIFFSIYVYLAPIIFTKDPFLGFNPTRGYVIIGAIIGGLMFYSLTRLITVYNSEASKKYIDSQEPIDTLGKKLHFMLQQGENKTELLVATALYVILPLEFTSPCFVWLFLGEEAGFVAKAIFTVCLLALHFIIFVLGNLSAFKFWDTKERQIQVFAEDMSKSEKRQLEKNERRAFKKMFAGLVAGYFIGSMGLMFFIPALWMAFSPIFILFTEPAVYISAIVLILFPTVFRSLRALSKRRRFIKELTELCKKKKFRLSKINSPYKSIFRLVAGETFKVSIGSKTYSCKLITSKRRSRPLYIMKNGIGGWLVQWKFISIELLSYTKVFSFGWESNHKKIIIVNPVPKKVLTPKGESFIPDENMEYYVSPKSGGLKPMVLKLKIKEYAVELDNCDIIDGYEFYTATGFLNALERDVIDIDY